MSDAVKGDMAQLKKMMADMMAHSDNQINTLNQGLNQKFDEMQKSFQTQIESTVAPIKIKQEELLKMFATLENRVNSLERANADDSGAMSDSSGVRIRATKKARAEPSSSSAPASSSSFRPPARPVSVGRGARPPLLPLPLLATNGPLWSLASSGRCFGP